MSTHQTDSNQAITASQVEKFQQQLATFLNHQVPLACESTYHEREDENWPRCLDINGSEQYGFDALSRQEIFDYGVQEGKILTARSVIDKLDPLFESLPTDSLNSFYQAICDTLNHYVQFARDETHNEKWAKKQAELIEADNDHGFDGDPDIWNRVTHEVFSLGVAQGTTLISRDIIDKLEPLFNQIETLQENATAEEKSKGKSLKP